MKPTLLINLYVLLVLGIALDLKSQNLISTHSVASINQMNALSPSEGSIVYVNNVGLYQYDGSVWINVETSVLDTNGLADIVNTIATYQNFIIDCDFCRDSYEVGDTLGCGVVVHTTKDGTHGLIMSLDNQFSRDFGCNSNISVAYLGSSKVDGLNNSLLINNDCSTSAASDCINYTTSCSDNDWFLPSSNQLRLMFRNFDVVNSVLIDLGKPQISTTNFYWSSTEDINETLHAWNTNDDSVIAVTYNSSSWENNSISFLAKSNIGLVRAFKHF